LSRASGGARSAGWQSRAAALDGELAPNPSWTLSASEIGAYAFCPQAWFLQRCRLPVTAETAARRDAGSRAHREIGRQTDLVRTAGVIQTALLIAIGVVLVLLAVLVVRSVS
jgi:hypothetical protein